MEKAVIDRRSFLKLAVASGGALAWGPFARAALAPEALAKGADEQYLGELAWLERRTRRLDELYGEGLDGRLYKDLAKLTRDTLVTPNAGFYVRTRASSLLDTTTVGRPWKITVRGLVKDPGVFDLDDLRPLVTPQGIHLLECSGNGPGGGHGLLSAARWAGISFRELLKKVQVLPPATRVLVSGFDEYPEGTPNTSLSKPGAGWVFTFDDLDSFGAFLATEMNGEPLPLDHGFPVRLIVPRWYGCCDIKWVNEVVLVNDEEPATSQMTEFATRTHQNGTPALAKDFVPATMDHAAMPIRVEKWRTNGKSSYRVVYRIWGILWGGESPRNDLLIRFGDEPYVPVQSCPLPETTATWSLWSHAWTPRAPGKYKIQLQLADGSVRKRRLDSGYYARSVEVTEV